MGVLLDASSAILLATLRSHPHTREPGDSINLNTKVSLYWDGKVCFDEGANSPLPLTVIVCD